MFQCNKIILGVKGHRENHWSVEIIRTANMRHVLHSSNRLVQWNIRLQHLKVPLNQCALRALSRVAAIFTYIEISALRVLAISEDFLRYVNELGSAVLRNHYIIKVLYVFVFVFFCCGRCRAECRDLLRNVEGRQGMKNIKQGDSVAREHIKT